MDDLTNHCKGLSISDIEGPTFDLEEELATPEYIIASKFYTRRALNMEAIALSFMHCGDQKMVSKSKIWETT